MTVVYETYEKTDSYSSDDLKSGDLGHNNEMKSNEQIINKDRLTIAMEFFVIFFLVLVYVFVLCYSNPTINYYSCDQLDLNKPYLKDTISTEALIFFGSFIPLVFIVAVELVNSNFIHKIVIYIKLKKKNERKSFNGRNLRMCLLHLITIFSLGIIITILLTEIIKHWVGRLRPYFLDVCKPNLAEIDCFNHTLNGQVYKSIFTGDGFCTGDAHRIKEARLSFPSGHASYSSYTMIFLILYLEARLFVDKKKFFKILLQFLAFLLCLVTSLSRISDFHHRTSDVVCGFLLGTTVAIFVTKHVGIGINYKEDTYIDIRSVSSDKKSLDDSEI